jgi:hypothetical protein
VHYGRHGRKVKAVSSWKFIGRHPIGAHVLVDGTLMPKRSSYPYDTDLLTVEALKLMAYVAELEGASSPAGWHTEWKPVVDRLTRESRG